MSDKKKNGGALLGAAFLMATSAIGPGFLTQTSKFTSDFQASFGFVILVSIILAAVAQMNIWRVLCVTGLRGRMLRIKYFRVWDIWLLLWLFWAVWYLISEM